VWIYFSVLYLPTGDLFFARFSATFDDELWENVEGLCMLKE
jgi:hypothetical protein